MVEPGLSECFGFVNRLRALLGNLDCGSRTSAVYQDALVEFIFRDKHIGGPIIARGCSEVVLLAQLAFMAKVIGTHLFVIDNFPEWPSQTVSLLEKLSLSTHTTLYQGTLAAFAAEFRLVQKPVLLTMDCDHGYERVREDIVSIYKLNTIPHAVAFHGHSPGKACPGDSCMDKVIRDSFGLDVRLLGIGKRTDELLHPSERHDCDRQGPYRQINGFEGVILFPPDRLHAGVPGMASDRLVGGEARKAHGKRLVTGFYKQYMSGRGLDIGFLGYLDGVVPILPDAIGVDLNYPGYDGKTLPFPDNSQDYVFSSHVLEHIPDYTWNLRDWYRVVKPGGHIVIVVPHQHLYEKKQDLPSNWNRDHKRFYTPGALLAEIEESLAPNTYRIMHLRDNDDGFLYNIPPERHSAGCYEIECVLRKIKEPDWHLS